MQIDNNKARGAIVAASVTLIGSVLVSISAGVITYRDMIAQNKFMLSTVQANQQDILSELKEVKSVVYTLTAAQSRDEADISRLYNAVYETKINRAKQ